MSLRLGWVPVLLVLTACAAQPDPDELARFRGGSVSRGAVDAQLMRAGTRTGRLDTEELTQIVQQRFEEEVLLASQERARVEAGDAFQERVNERSDLVLARSYLSGRPPAAVSEDEVRAEFEQLRETLDRPERRMVYNLFLAVPKGASAEAAERTCARLDDIRTRILAGASFEREARQHSQSATAPQGGAVGLVHRGQLSPQAEQVVFSLQAGELGTVFRDAFGCHLLRVSQVQNAIRAELPSYRVAIQLELQERRRREQFARELELAAESLDLSLPDFEAAARGDQDPVFEFADRRISRAQLARRATAASLPGPMALQQQIGDVLFAHLMRRDHSELATQIDAQERRAVLVEQLRQQALLALAGEISEETLRAFHGEHRLRYRSEPAYEFELYLWPLADLSPLEATRRAEQFIAEGAGTSPRQMALPLLPLRQLARRDPTLVRAIRPDLTDGALIGPFRHGPEVAVARAKLVVPARDPSFLEVRDRVLADYLGSGSRGLLERWREQLRQDYEYQAVPEQIARYGEDLMAEIVPSPLAGDPDDAARD